MLRVITSFSIFLALSAACCTAQRANDDLRDKAGYFIDQEIGRIENCGPVSKTSPPPVHVKVIWKAPADVRLTSLTEKQNKSYTATIEFVINYEQSDFFDTDQEAQNAKDFQLLFATRHRHTYEVNDLGLKLVNAEYFNDSDKKWGKEDPPSSFCWEQTPN